MSCEQTNGVSILDFPLEELSWTVTKNASIVSQYLRANHLRQPSSHSDGPSTVLPAGSPQYVQAARQELISASLEISQLAVGPSEFLPNLATGVRLKPLPPPTFVIRSAHDPSSNTSLVFPGFANTTSFT